MAVLKYRPVGATEWLESGDDRPALQRPLDRQIHGRRSGGGPRIHGRRLGRPLRLLALRADQEGRGRPGRRQRTPRRGRTGRRRGDPGHRSRRRLAQGAIRADREAGDQAERIKAGPRPRTLRPDGPISRPESGLHPRAPPCWAIVVERERARFGAWYEMFPRSTSPEPGQHGTFKTTEARLPYVAGMGFDVVYLPPIHPIGRAFRKGPNNTLTPGPDDPGSSLGDRRARGRAQGGPPRARHAGRLRPPGRRRPQAEPGDRARHRLPVLAGPSLRQGASRLVPPSAGRHDQVCREPAQEVSGHLSDRLRVRGLAGRCYAELRDVFLFWIGHGVTIFRVDNPTPSRSGSGTG